MTASLPFKSGGAFVLRVEPDEDDEEALQSAVARRVASCCSLSSSSESKAINLCPRIRNGANRIW